MDIVDTQIHLGPGRIEETLAGMNAVGITSALIDEFWTSMPMMPYYKVAGGAVHRPATPTAELAALTYPDRFSYLTRVDRRDPELRSLIRLAADRPQMRALRIAPGLDSAEVAALAGGAYDDVFSAALDSGLSVVFVVMPGNGPALESSLKKFPGMKFVIDHCGMPTPAAFREGLAKLGVTEPVPEVSGTAAIFDTVLRLADAHSNVGLKWAHAPQKFEVSGYPFEGLRPYLRKALDSFGAERVMWASDATANLTGECWAQLLYWLVHNPEMSNSERASLLGGTARKWLNWPNSKGTETEAPARDDHH